MTQLLRDLDDLGGYRVSADDADPRGWAVVSCTAAAVATVRSLLVDTESLKVRYLICVRTVDGSDIALPVSLARLDPGDKQVIFDLTDTSVFGQLPAYLGSLNKETEDRIQELLIGEKLPEPPSHPSPDRRGGEPRPGGASSSRSGSCRWA